MLFGYVSFIPFVVYDWNSWFPSYFCSPVLVYLCYHFREFHLLASNFLYLSVLWNCLGGLVIWDCILFLCLVTFYFILLTVVMLWISYVRLLYHWCQAFLRSVCSLASPQYVNISNIVSPMSCYLFDLGLAPLELYTGDDYNPSQSQCCHSCLQPCCMIDEERSQNLSTFANRAVTCWWRKGRAELRLHCHFGTMEGRRSRNWHSSHQLCQPVAMGGGEALTDVF